MSCSSRIGRLACPGFYAAIGSGAGIAPCSPSRPGELHPEPLTGPDVSLSTYPDRTTFEGCRLPPTPAGPSCCQLTLIDPHADRLLTSLHGNYPASPLLRSSPPLVCASVLSASRFGSCAFSLTIADQVLKFRTKARTGVTPPVPRTSPGQSAGFRQTAPRVGRQPRF